ncbi:MAG: hypothetical protein IJ939_06015 [Clostridia bacterium]|nr:hypothetical protein [Clostridia bacterium]
MGNKKKFDKIERNETYYEAYGDEEEKKQEKKKEKKKTEILPGIDLENVPEKEKLSSRFTYKREKKKVVQDKSQAETVPAVIMPDARVPAIWSAPRGLSRQPIPRITAVALI